MRIDETLVEEFVTMYKDGMLIQDIASRFNLSRPTVRKYLQKRGVTKKKIDIMYGKETEDRIVNLYNRYRNISKVSSLLGISNGGARKALIRNGVALRKVTRKFPLTLDEFTNIEVERYEKERSILGSIKNRPTEKIKRVLSRLRGRDSDSYWYYVGLLYADGCCDVNEKRCRVVLSLKVDDADAVRGFSEYFGTSFSITNRNQATCSIQSKHIVKHLFEEGVVPRKSLTLQPPKNVPVEYVHSFIRGYMDGDGSVSKDGTLSILGTADMVLWLIEKLNLSKGDYRIGQKDPSKNTFDLRLNKASSHRALSRLYENSEVHMQRKYERYCANL